MMLAIVHLIGIAPSGKIQLTDDLEKAYEIALAITNEHDLTNVDLDDFLVTIKTDNEYFGEDDNGQEWSIHICQCQ